MASVKAAAAASEARLERVPTDSLIPNPRNPRKHPEDQLERLVASLRRDGQTRPLLVRRANNMLIAGHGVHLAAKRAGLAEVLVRFLDVDQRTADRLMVGDNRQGELSRNDEMLLAELVREIDPGDLLATGFSADEAEKLFSQGSDEIEVHQIATGDVEDVFWIAVRGPLGQQADVLQRIKVLLSEHPAVTIELGTVEGF